MTKAAELAKLDATIAAFGPDSYIGPWLTENRTTIRADIERDHPISAMLIGESYREAEHIITNAKTHADELINAAKARAKQIDDDAYNRANQTRESLRAFLRRELDRANSL